MNIILKIAGIISVPAILTSSVQEHNIPDIKTSLMTNKCSAEFDTSAVFEAGFAPVDISDTYESISGRDFPESFDLRDSGLIQNVKVQGGYGTCWAQTASDSAETSLIKRRPDIDLSEWHLAYYSYTGGDQIDLGDMSGTEEIFKYGGSALVALNTWSQWRGPVTEKEGLEYGNTNILTDSELQEKYSDYADYHLKNAYLFDFNGDNPELRCEILKEFLLNGQAVDVSYYNDSGCYDYSHHSYMSGQNKNATHSVTIIGYDDNFPAGNFSSKALPENNGAWLAKNSWGNTWQDGGFFWISYEEPSLCEFAVFELEDSDNYAKNYHHDTFISNQTMRAENGNTSYMANVFQSEGNEWLQAVSCNFAVPDTDYTIEIYRNLKSASDPKSGKKAYSISGKNSISGYQTIELDENVELSEGEYFSIVIAMTNDNNPYVIPVESCISVINPDTGEITDLSNHTRYEQIKEYTHKNESFYSSNGKIWTDVTDSVYTYTESQKKTFYNNLISMYGKDYVSSFDENFGNCDVVIAQGNIPVKAFTNPVNHVSFSTDSGLVYPDETIELSCGNSQDIYYSINGGEYTLYTEPFQITEKCTITATSDYETYSEKEYTPAYGTLNRLGYTFNKNVNAQYITPDENGNYTIDTDESRTGIMLLPISQGNVEINGKATENYYLSEKIPLRYGKNTISIRINTESSAPEKINLTVNVGDSEFLYGDVNNDGVINASDSSDILAEYASMSAGESGNFDEKQKKSADFNDDGIINASDASEVLKYYAEKSSGN